MTIISTLPLGWSCLSKLSLESHHRLFIWELTCGGFTHNRVHFLFRCSEYIVRSTSSHVKVICLPLKLWTGEKVPKTLSLITLVTWPFKCHKRVSCKIFKSFKFLGYLLHRRVLTKLETPSGVYKVQDLIHHSKLSCLCCYFLSLLGIIRKFAFFCEYNDW